MRWESEYCAQHPEVHFENQLHGASAVMAGLYNGVADVALMGREIWPVETMAYQWVYQQQPFGIDRCYRSDCTLQVRLFTPVVIVNAKNPLASISLSQLDAIYGSEHRVAPANIRDVGPTLALKAHGQRNRYTLMDSEGKTHSACISVAMLCAPISSPTLIAIWA